MRFMEFELETITPLFMAGYDGRTPELRPPSFKGMMRFWWRAMNGHLSLNSLKERESEIFGGSGENQGKSKIIIRVSSEKPTFISYSPVPHKSANFSLQAIQPGHKFQCHLILRDISYQERAVLSFKLSLLLGGFGKRSRRGFGSVKINKIDDKVFDFDYSINSVFDLLNSIEDSAFRIEQGRIIRNISANNEANYPYIKEIKIGKEYSDYKDILIKIGESSHVHKDDSLGFARNQKRFASPIYVSVIKDDKPYRPVITTLNTAFEDNRSITSKMTENQELFKKAIL